MKKQKRLLCLTIMLACLLFVACQTAIAQQTLRDPFFWIGQINKASTVINSDEGLIDKAQAARFADTIAQVLENGAQPGATRPSSVITFEPLLIEIGGPEITFLHAGRSSQDMLATARGAMIREDILALAEALNSVIDSLINMAEEHKATIVPSYTNGVAAQPTSYGHYLLAYASGFQRDVQRLQQYYARLNLSPMGTTVLNGTSWPLNRYRMAEYLGFDDIAYNAYDANQIFNIENGAELGFLVNAISLHIGTFIEDVMQQYAQPRPWILLEEGGENTYVSSAMPQKRNPGILNSTRTDASTLLGYAVAAVTRAHNIPPGMADARSDQLNDMIQMMTRVTNSFDRTLNALVINPARALEELNLDWTASQEVADNLMRQYNVPFRVGHHVASEIVTYGRANNITPMDFPYAEVQRIYAETAANENMPGMPRELPMTEAEFKASLDPLSIINNRATVGGPQPAEMEIMLDSARNALAGQVEWVSARYAQIAAGEAKLESDFAALLQ